MHTWHAQCVEAMLNEALLTRGLLTFQLPRYIHLWGLIDGRAFPSAVRFLLRSDWGTKLLHAVIVLRVMKVQVCGKERKRRVEWSHAYPCAPKNSPDLFLALLHCSAEWTTANWACTCSAEAAVQLWYFLSPHKPPASTHSTWGCGEIGYKTVSNQRNAFLLFHSVFHLDAQILLKVQKVLLLMAYFTWP